MTGSEGPARTTSSSNLLVETPHWSRRPLVLSASVRRGSDAWVSKLHWTVVNLHGNVRASKHTRHNPLSMLLGVERSARGAFAFRCFPRVMYTPIWTFQASLPHVQSFNLCTESNGTPFSRLASRFASVVERRRSARWHILLSSTTTIHHANFWMRPSLLLLALTWSSSVALSNSNAPRFHMAQPQPILKQTQATVDVNMASRMLRLRGGDQHSLSLDGASRMVKACAFFASLDALLLGYDIGVVSGILVFVQDQFKLSLLETGNFAAALNAAAIVGALASGYIADQFGRKPALFISSLMFTAGSFLMAGANSYKSLLLGRYIQGYGVGAGLLISPMFISEIAPPAFRGSLVTLSEVSLSLGVLLAYIVNVALSGLPNQWRWMLRLGAVPGVLLTLRILFLPESPRFLVGQGKEEEAKQVLRVVMDNEPESAADATLKEIKARAAEESGSTWSMLLHKGTLFAVLVGAVLAALQHAVGIESIIYHSPIIFEKAGIETKRHAMMGTVAMGCIKLVFETYALLNVDRIGRRPLLLLGSAGLTGALLVLGASLRAKVMGGIPGITSSTYTIFGSIAAYSAFHAISFGPITWLVLAEIFPAVVKGKAMGIATTVNRCTSFIAALTFLTMCDRMQWGGTVYVYAGFSVFALIFYALFVPETTGMPLEDISPLFDEPRKLMRTNLRSLGLLKGATKA